MHFDLIDAVLERTPDRIITLKNVSAAEEYLQDHFPSFPVLPGVMMLECMVHAARRLLDPDNTAPLPWVLGRVRALRYGTFVKPGDSLIIEVTRKKPDAPDFTGEVKVRRATNITDLLTAASGRFELRPTNVHKN
jgi:3-hydroxyacyl-[acyl-carrier-protein] dehydratase